VFELVFLVDKLAGFPGLHITVDYFKSGLNYVYSVSFHITKDATSKRTGRSASTEVYATSSYGIAPRNKFLESLNEFIEKETNTFCNHYLAANP
jgi:hypothetical protein